LKRHPAITSLILALAGLMGLSYKVYAKNSEISRNTRYRLTGQYNETLNRIYKLSERCGDKAEKCGPLEQKLMADWKLIIGVVGKKLGYPTEIK